MNPYEAIKAHWEWRVGLRLFVAGYGAPLEASTVGRDDLCDLGMWLHGEGVKHASARSYGELLKAHAAFHQAAAAVVRRTNEGDRDGAKALAEPGGAFDHASNAVVLAILKLAADLEPA